VPRPKTVQDARQDRLKALLASSPPVVSARVAELMRLAGPLYVNVIVPFVSVAGPLYLRAGVATYHFLDSLPWDLLQATLGLGLCFFGGGYCASIAAIEAFAQTGWPVTRAALLDVYEEALLVYRASQQDDKKDDDGDGVADVKQLDGTALMQRKAKMAAAAVRDPQKLALALGGLYGGWVAVQGVLRVKFAMTVTIAVSLSQFVEYYVLAFLLPLVSPLVDRELRHWVPAALQTATKGFFVALAWMLQTVVSAVQSAMRGGLMFSRGVLNHLNKQGTTEVFGIKLEKEHTYLDEVIGYSVAALGFAIQWQWGFSLPFPFNIVMLPFDLVEWYIRWSVSSGAAPAV